MKKAFTMIELIFVIVIIGILVAVAIPKLAATRDDAKVVAIASSVANAANEIAAKSISTGVYSSDMTSMSNVVSSMVAKGEAALSGNTLNIKMNTISDCLKLSMVGSSEDANLTLTYGTAGADSVCLSLQSAMNVAEYPIPLKGIRVTF